jgi:hypothetical protein
MSRRLSNPRPLAAVVVFVADLTCSASDFRLTR